MLALCFARELLTLLFMVENTYVLWSCCIYVHMHLGGLRVQGFFNLPLMSLCAFKSCNICRFIWG